MIDAAREQLIEVGEKMASVLDDMFSHDSMAIAIQFVGTAVIPLASVRATRCPRTTVTAAPHSPVGSVDSLTRLQVHSFLARMKLTAPAETSRTDARAVSFCAWLTASHPATRLQIAHSVLTTLRSSSVSYEVRDSGSAVLCIRKRAPC
jgi:hypothetical protein